MKRAVLYYVTRPKLVKETVNSREDKSMFSMFDGYKTYLIMFVLLVCVALEVGLGWDVPGFEVGDDWFNWVLAALGLGALRNGMPK